MPKPKVTFQILREIAEAASGLRDNDLYFVIREGDPVIGVSETPVQEDDDTVVIHCDPTPGDPPSTVRFAEIGAGAGKRVNLMRVVVPQEGIHPGGTFQADAVFWSVAAVEKFLVPYYASVYGDHGPEFARVVKDVLLRPRDSAAPGAFAVAHLPSSEYVPMESAAARNRPAAHAHRVPNLAALTPQGARHLVVHPAGAQGPAAPSARARGSRSR